jgi:predicted phosphoribosyltransferase
MGPHRFLGRRQAGKLLATRLDAFADSSPLIIALSPGGTIVADAVAAALRARLALWCVPSPDVRSRTVIAVDDGLLEVAPARAALRAMRSRTPTHLVLAVPVADRAASLELRADVDVVVSLQLEDDLPSVAARYRAFRDISEEEARELFESARARTSADSTRRMRATPSSMPPP